MPSKNVRIFFFFKLKNRGITDSECMQGRGDGGKEENLRMGPWALMIGKPSHCSFTILGLKLLYQNLLHFIGRVYLLLDSSCSPVKN